MLDGVARVANAHFYLSNLMKGGGGAMKIATVEMTVPSLSVTKGG